MLPVVTAGSASSSAIDEPVVPLATNSTNGATAASASHPR